MVSSEKAFDMLPSAVDIYEKLDVDAYRKRIAEESKGKKLDAQSVGINLMKYILVNTPKIKEEFFNIAAIFEDKTVDEVKAQPFMQTVSTIKAVFADKELMSFFKQAI